MQKAMPRNGQPFWHSCGAKADCWHNRVTPPRRSRWICRHLAQSPVHLFSWVPESTRRRPASWLQRQRGGGYRRWCLCQFGLGNIGVGCRRDRGNYFRTLVGDLPEVQIVKPGHGFQTTAGTWKVRFDAGHSPGHMSLMDRARHLYIGVDFLLPRISPNSLSGPAQPGS